MQSNYPMRLLLLKWSSLSKRVGILSGLLAGLIVSLFIPSFNQCSSFSESSSSWSSNIKSSNWFEEVINSDYNPIVKLPVINGSNPPSEQLKALNSKRPRFVLDELDVNDQLLIIVLTSDQSYFNLGHLLNETLIPYADRILFFKESIYSESPISSSTSSSSQSPSPIQSAPSSSQSPISPSDSSLPFIPPSPSLINLYPTQTSEPVLSRILTYLNSSYDSGKIKTYLQGHNFIFFITDNSYVKGDLLRSIVNQLSVNDHIFAPGRDIVGDILDPNQRSSRCSDYSPRKLDKFNNFVPGLLVSSSLIVSCQAQLECLSRACNDTLIKSYSLSPDHSDKLLLDPNLFNSSLITYPLFTTKAYANVHHFHLQSSLNHNLGLLNQLENKIKAFVDEHRTQKNKQWTSTWPLGIVGPHRPIDRFDVVRWSYLENGIVHMPDDFDVLRQETESEKIDRQTIEHLARRWLIRRYPAIKSPESIQITSIYRRYEVHRGIDYILDLKVANKNQAKLPNFEIRIEAVKPLVPMTIIDQIPFATEQNRISLIVPVRSDEEVSDIISLINQYVNLCNKKQSRNLALIIALITHNSSPPSGYGRVISLQTKFQNLGCKLLLSTIPREPNESYSTSTDLGLLMLLRKRFTQTLTDSIIVLCSSNTIISSDYLTRIQLNTIKGYQVYFPIPFQEYNLRPGSSGSPEYSWTIKKDNGFFNWFDYRHVAFYLDDFEQACDTILSPLSSLSASIDKQSAETNKLLVDYDLLQLFLQFNCHSSINSGLHILRSIDPELRLRYRNEKCDPEVDRFTQHWCNMTRVYSLGNKAQLANLILNYKKIKFSN